MSSASDANLAFEVAYVRKVLLAAEILDAVTLEPVREGIAVSGSGLNADPIINGSGLYVWLEQGNRRPTQIVVDPLDSPYQGATAPVPPLPQRSVRIELAPKVGYPFGSGVTAVGGTLIQRSTGPRIPVSGAEAWLRWVDDAANGTTWVDSPIRSQVDANGDFAVVLRLAPNQLPRLDANGALRARLGARLRGITRTSEEIPLLQGRVLERSDPFVWNEFTLSP
jgi:hypothetical protein